MFPCSKKIGHDVTSWSEDYTHQEGTKIFISCGYQPDELLIDLEGYTYITEEEIYESENKTNEDDNEERDEQPPTSETV